jgi:hypothetical protein
MNRMATLVGGSTKSAPYNESMNREIVRQVYYRPQNPHGVGRCWHCGTALPWAGSGKRSWHVDHWPVAQRDIHRQLALGVTRVDDLSNLVPSCVKCNTSHKYEIKRWYWGGRSQCPLTPHMLAAVLALLLGWALLR